MTLAIKRIACLTSILFCSGMRASVAGQQQAHPELPVPFGGPSIDGRSPSSSDPEGPRRAAAAARFWAADNQRRLEKDSAELKQLTADLKCSADGVCQQMAEATWIRKLDRIEKLAIDVKKRMSAKT